MGGAHTKKTTPGLLLSSGRIVDDYNLADFSTAIQDIEIMRKSDCVASMALEALKLPIQRAKIEIIGEGESKEYIQYCFENMMIDENRDDGFNYFYNHILLSLDFGLILFEPVWSIEQYNGKWTKRLKYMSPIKPSAITKFLYNENQEIVRLELRRYGSSYSYDTIECDIKDLFLITYNEEFFDIRGNSVLRKARLAWKYKDRVMKAFARGKTRQAGIPKIKLPAGAGQDVINNAHTIGQTLGNADNAYVVCEDGIEIELMQLQDSNSLEFLQYLDRQMLINTLTQFMISGVGENGSRAAASELKTPYELKINELSTFVEVTLNRLIIKMIENSPWNGTIPGVNYPKVKISVPVAQDLDVVATMIQKLASVIKLDDKDESYIRDIFSLPKKEEKAEKKTFEKVKLEKIKLDVQSAENAYKEFQERAQNILSKIHKEMLDIIIPQAIAGKKIERLKMADFISEMEKIYLELKTVGRLHALNELGLTLMDKKEEKVKKQKIARAVKTLYYDTEQAVENLIEEATKKQKQDLSKYLYVKLSDGMKMDKLRIVESVLDGYQESRIETFQEYGKDRIYIYTSILDSSICENCAPLDGLEATLDEWEEQGLRIDGKGRLNPECSGSEKCRCTLTLKE